MFRLTRPDTDVVRALLGAQRGAALTYPEVGATRAGAPPGYRVDHHRIRLGTGHAVYVRAVEALRAWRMMALGWAAVVPSRAPLRTGESVAIVVRHLGFWSVHACRIVYTVDETTDDAAGDVRRFGFAYGTLPAHAATGEERFLVEWDRADDGVWYDLYAFSRPRHPLARLGHPIARWQQRRFGRDSKQAMLAAVRDGGAGGAVTDRRR